MEIGNLWVKIGAKTDELQKGVYDAKAALQAFADQAERMGTAMSVGVTAPMVLMGSKAVAASRDMNEAMARIATLLPNQPKLVERLKEEVQALANEMGKAPVEMADGLMQVISSFPEAQEDTAQAMEFLKASARAGVAGVASMTDSVGLLAAVIKSYQLSMGDAAKVSDYAFRTVDLGDTTYAELAASMGDVLPMAATMKVTFEDLWGAMATLTGVTGNTAAVTTQLRATFRALMDPTDTMAMAIGDVARQLVDLGKLKATDPLVRSFMEAQGAFDRALSKQQMLLAESGGEETKEVKAAAKELENRGKAVREAGAALGGRVMQSAGLLDTLTMLREWAGGNDKVLSDMLGRVEALTGVLALTGALADDMRLKTGRMFQVEGSTEVAYAEQVNGINALGHRMSQMSSEVQTAFQELGDALAPVVGNILDSLQPLLDGVRNLIDWFEDAPGPLKGFITEIAQLAVEAGPILLAVAGFNKLYSAVSALFTGPQGWIVAGVALIVRFYEAWATAKAKEDQYVEAAMGRAANLQKEADGLRALLTQYEELAKKPKPTADEQARLNGLLQAMIDKSPSLENVLDTTGKAYDRNAKSVNDYIKALEAQSFIEVSAAAFKAMTDLPKLESQKADLEAKKAKLEAPLTSDQQALAATAAAYGKWQTLLMDADKAYKAGAKPEVAYERVMNMFKYSADALGISDRILPKNATELLSMDIWGKNQLYYIDLAIRGYADKRLAGFVDRSEELTKTNDALDSLTAEIKKLKAAIEQYEKDRKKLGLASGGLLPGRSGPDQFPALLAPGEAVVPAHAVWGGPEAVYEWFRSMGVPGFAEGGIAGAWQAINMRQLVAELEARHAQAVINAQWDEYPVWRGSGEGAPAGLIKYETWEGVDAKGRPYKEVYPYAEFTYADIADKLRTMGVEWQKPADWSWSDWMYYLEAAAEGFSEGWGLASPLLTFNYPRYRNEDWMGVPHIHERGFPYPGMDAAEASLYAMVEEMGYSVPDAIRDVLGYYVGSDVVMGATGPDWGELDPDKKLARAALELVALYEHGIVPDYYDRLPGDSDWWAYGPDEAIASTMRSGITAYNYVTWPTVVHERTHKWQSTLADYADYNDPNKMRRFLSYEQESRVSGGYEANAWEVEAREATQGAWAILHHAREVLESGRGKELRSLLNGVNTNIVGMYDSVMPYLGLAGVDWINEYMKGAPEQQDHILSLLAPGEAVVPADVVSGGWWAVADWLSGLGIPGYAEGGIVGGTSGLGAVTGEVVSTAVDQMPILKAMLSAGSIEEVLVTLITNSKGFSDIIARLNPLIQAVADSFGALLIPLQPIVSVLTATLVPILRVVGTLMEAVLTPLMQLLFPALKLLGLVMLKVAELLGGAWNIIAKGINAVLGWLGVELKLIDLKGLSESFDALKNLTWEQAMATEAATKALGNVPSGFKIALRRFESATGIERTGSVRGIALGAPQAGAAGGLTVIIQGDVYGFEDFKRKVHEAQSSTQRGLRLSAVGTV